MSVVDEVLAEEWTNDGGNCIFVNGAEHGNDSAWFRDANASHSTRFIVIDAERARQAALGHRALRLLAGASVIFHHAEDADEARAIIKELRNGQ